VPHDISVVGCDDTQMAQLASPPLTTVRIPKYQMGWEAARRLIERLEGNEPERILLDTDLVIRGSVRKLN